MSNEPTNDEITSDHERARRESNATSGTDTDSEDGLEKNRQPALQPITSEPDEESRHSFEQHPTLKRPESRGADRDSFYSIESGVASVTFQNVHHLPGPSAAGSFYAASNNDNSLVSGSSRPQHTQGTISSVKIISPEEIFKENSFTYTTDDNRSPTSETPPHRQAWRNVASSGVGASGDGGSNTSLPHKSGEPIISNTRLSTNDTRMIMNISTEAGPTQPVGSKGKRVSIANSTTSINEKNLKLVQKLDEANQNAADSGSASKKVVVGVNEEDEEAYPANHSTPPFARRPSVADAMNRYANIENAQGFVGAAALAFASLPTPGTLLRRGSDKLDEEFRKFTEHYEAHPTPAADVIFQRGHTRMQIFRHRMTLFGYLLREYLKLGLQSISTIKGFFVFVYFLLVIAFGGMLFLLLLNAAPAMSREWGPDDKVHSPRQIWIEIDSQILNALFCITGLGLFPIRCRDLYLWIRGRYLGDIYCNAKILKIHSSWFWAGFTSDWKLLLVIVLYILNSVFQVLLCFVMWHYNRFTRPSWTTGVLIAASFTCVIIAGIVMFVEARRIKTFLFQTGRERTPGLSFGASSQDVDKENAMGPVLAAAPQRE